jgi:hypothetical protein
LPEGASYGHGAVAGAAASPVHKKPLPLNAATLAAADRPRSPSPVGAGAAGGSMLNS